MDTIRIHNAQFYGYHGVNPDERVQGQTFAVDIAAHLDLSKPGRSDRIDDTVNYTHLWRIAKEVIEGPPRNLLEAVAEAIAERILGIHQNVQAVDVRITKPRPPIPGAHVDGASVEIHRTR